MEGSDIQLNNLTVWQKFCRNKLAFSGLLVIVLVTLVAISGYLIIPDKSKFSNQQSLEIAAKEPGFTVQFLKIPLQASVEELPFYIWMFSGKPSQYQYIPIDSCYIASGMVWVKRYSNTSDIEKWENYSKDKFCKDLNMPILQDEFMEQKTFLFGTDRFGRDMLSRLVIGARISLSVGFIAVFISLLIGVFLGAMAGYFRGRVDKVIMWLVNVIWSVPTLLMVIAITMVLGKGFWQVFIAVGLTMWVDVARVVRGQVLSIREKDYIEACKAMGFSNTRIIWKHVIPGVIGPIIILSAANFASAILIESGLSFLGVGIQPPTPSWGSMIKEQYGYIILDKAYLALLPGFTIMILSLAFTFVGNGLRDAFDARSVQVQS